MRPIASPASRRSGTPALACHALMEVGSERADRAGRARPANGSPLQVLDLQGDWAMRRPALRPGGWAFQYANAHYPDLDDTAVVVMAHGPRRSTAERPAICASRSRARANGSSACKARTAAGAPSTPTTTTNILNNIPFADHGALLDPPTEDVSARCVSMLAQLGDRTGDEPGARARRSTICARRNSPTAAGSAAGA